MTASTKDFWQAAYQNNIARLVGICYRYTRNYQLAEDLAHDAFLKAIDRFETFAGKGKFEGWLRRIVVNHALQYLRDRKKDPYVDDLLADLESPDPIEETLSPIKAMTFTIAELIDTIDQLPEHHRLVFNLYVLEKFTHAQIGSALGITEGTSKSHLARARRKLQQLLVQKAEETRNENEHKKALILLLSRHADENTDQIFRKCFDDFSIPPPHPLSLDSTQFPIQHYFRISTFLKSNINILVTSAVLSIVVVTVLGIRQREKPEQNMPTIEKISSSPPQTATNLQDSVMLKTNLKRKQMKPLDSLALMLALSSGSVNTVTAKDSIKTQIEKHSAVETTLPADTVITRPPLNADKALDTTRKERGTFNATELFWSETNNELYFKGKVRVNFKKDHFEGNGSMTFLGKVHLLIVDGQEVSIGKTIKLNNEEYQLAMLDGEKATAKYGDKGLYGAVEITRKP